MRRELDEMAQRLDDEISGLAGEMRAARDELHRYRPSKRPSLSSAISIFGSISFTCDKNR
jgi:hypothetical protein